jgi:hypothetical protein
MAASLAAVVSGGVSQTLVVFLAGEKQLVGRLHLVFEYVDRQ